MRAGALAILVAALAVAPMARGGHELPIYRSFYPHEISVETIDPAGAARLLADAGIHAYVGALRFVGAPPDAVGAVDSLGAFVIVTVDPATAGMPAPPPRPRSTVSPSGATASSSIPIP